MSNKQDLIFKGLKSVSMLTFFALCIESGSLLFNFIYSCFNPNVTNNIYKGLNLSELYEKQFVHYVLIMSLIVLLSILKAYLFYLVVKIFLKLNLVHPFSIDIAGLIEKISFKALLISVVSLIAHQYSKCLIQNGLELGQSGKYWGDAGAFLMMAAVIYIIAYIFKKGISLQNENDLTI